MPETEQLLRRVIEIVESAPGLPMSASVRINKDELLELLDDAVAQLPEELRSARWLLKEREEFTARTRREGEEIITDARTRVANMVQRTEVAKAAEVRARQIIEEAEAEARRMRRETEDFCDQKLASFEIVLERISQTVATGRSRLAAPTIEEAELSDLDDEDRDDGPTVFDQEL
jgi:cell division septum initiation protein DivIVA